MLVANTRSFQGSAQQLGDSDADVSGSNFADDLEL